MLSFGPPFSSTNPRNNPSGGWWNIDTFADVNGDGIDDLLLSTANKEEAASSYTLYLGTTDGLSEELPAAQIGDLLSTPGTVERRARALLEAALFRGARDDVSVVVVAVAGTGGDGWLEVDTSPSVRSTPASLRAKPSRKESVSV